MQTGITANNHARLGLSWPVRACLFDLDGVLTRTADVHAQAWKSMFDAFLRARAHATGTTFREFDLVHDYDLYVDGKPRLAGASAFLASRGIQLPEGAEDDPATVDSLRGLGKRKNAIFLSLIEKDGVQVYASSVHYLEAVRQAGLLTAVVSSSRNGERVLRAAQLTHLFDARVDGIVAAREHLAGKPAPDTYLAAARKVGCSPLESAIFEDALAGVEAGRAGKFRLVVGVDRLGQADALREHGADLVVSDLAELLRMP